MNSFKEFLEKQTMASIPRKYRLLFPTMERYLSINSLGEFFWNRYGKLFALSYIKTEFVGYWGNVFIAAESVRGSEASFTEADSMNALDFLDAVDCLGKEEIKKRVKELGK